MLGVAAGLAALPLLLVVVAFAAGALGIGSERLRHEAEQAIEAVAGPGLDVAAGPARLTFDPSRLLALELRDLGVERVSGGKLLEAEFVRFGIELLPLLSGKVRLSSAELTDAKFLSGAGEGADWTASIRNTEGLLDPDLVSAEVFRAVHAAFDAIDHGATGEVRLENVEIALTRAAGPKGLRLVEAALTGDGAGGLSLKAEAETDGRLVEVEATARRDGTTKRIAALELTARSDMAAAAGVGAEPARPGHGLGAFSLGVSAVEGGAERGSRLVATLKLREAALDLGKRGVLEGDVDFQGTLVGGSNKVAVDRLDLLVGRSRFAFYGAIGPRPPDGEDAPAYRFDLISPDASIAPEASSEPALDGYLRLTGRYVAGERMLVADEIVVDSGRGEALGTVSARLADGAAPGITAAFSVSGMPVADVKQLWPWFSAAGARGWVMDNLFGGTVAEGRVEFHVEPGRMGNGVPLGPREVSGFFTIEGTRFDTAGLIPPVRDAVGSVGFRGNDVEISLSSGTVFLPSGRSVAASNGTMRVESAHRKPVIGALDIDVAGEAAAVAELASYDPIDAMRRIGFSAEDFSGEVTGNVKADIPLHKGIDRDRLGWLVALDYRDLSIARSIDGQLVTGAAGSITVDPLKAVIEATARLNGIPAEIEAVEPLGKADEAAARHRLVRLVLDDAAREAIAPGIAELVKGAVPVSLDVAGPSRRVEADLTKAELWIPWTGWTKGPGVPASVSFELDSSEGRAVLSEFKLSGESFDVEGSLTLSGGSVAAAKFTRVKLNRGDDVAVSVSRTGKGFFVDVRGASFDARSVVKRFVSDANDGKKRGKGSSVAITADVKTMTGFHGERLSNVRLDYEGSPERLEGLDVRAVTASGKGVEIRNGSQGGGRSMRMRSADAGALLRFLDLYEHMQGGAIEVSLTGKANGPMSGRVDARDFWVVDEPRLGSLVSSRPSGDRMSLNDAVRRDIDTSRVRFEQGFTEIAKGDGYLKVSNGVLRGPLLGFIFQGTLYDEAGDMNMTGTFMPAYGINRIFGEIPLLGMFLGNGRDRGLIGVTFRLRGDASAPDLQINPLSVMAPGIFRSIFEYR